MITAIVNIDLYRYEIHSLLKAFYPQEDVKVLTSEDAAANRKYQQIAQEPFLRVVFADTEVTLSFCDGSDTRTALAPEGISFACNGTILKTQMKHLLYAMLADREGRTLPWGELIGIRPTKRPCFPRRLRRERGRSSLISTMRMVTASMSASLFVRPHASTVPSHPLTWHSGETR